MRGEVFNFRVVRVKDKIPPGLAKMTTIESFDQGMKFAYRGDGHKVMGMSVEGYTPSELFDVEFRVLSYDIVSTEGQDIFETILQ